MKLRPFQRVQVASALVGMLSLATCAGNPWLDVPNRTGQVAFFVMLGAAFVFVAAVVIDWILSLYTPKN